MCWRIQFWNSRLARERISAGIFRKEPRFNSAARLSALNQSTPKADRGKRLLLPLPGGPAITIIRGRCNLAAEVGTRIFTHIFGEFVLQKRALFVNDP